MDAAGCSLLTLLVIFKAIALFLTDVR